MLYVNVAPKKDDQSFKTH